MNARRTLLCGSALAAAALALSFGAAPASAQDGMRSYCLASSSSSTAACPRHETSRRAPPAMSRGSAGPCRSRTSMRRRSGRRVLSRVRRAAGSRRITLTSKVSSVGTRPAPSGPSRRVAPSGTGAPRAAAHRPTIPTARWETAGSARRSRRTTSGGLHTQFLGPVADQALNPTSRPGVEQNTREKTVCQMVKTGRYADLFEAAWGGPIDCKQQGDPPAYHISFKKLAVAVAAWQGSPDVNSFSSPRDACISGAMQMRTANFPATT